MNTHHFYKRTSFPLNWFIKTDWPFLNMLLLASLYARPWLKTMWLFRLFWCENLSVHVRSPTVLFFSSLFQASLSHSLTHSLTRTFIVNLLPWRHRNQSWFESFSLPMNNNLRMSGAMFLMLKKSSDRRQREALEEAFKVGIGSLVVFIWNHTP